MIKFLVKKFIKNSEDVKNSTVREKYGILGGALGIICNLFLFGLKLAIGLLINAIAIVSDAFNNLTDSFSSLVSIISAKLSNKKPDKDHPFGHGRIEYIATMIVALVIMVVGVELLKSSADKLIDGIKNHGAEGVTFDTLTIISMVILVLSLLVKLWMYSYNTFLGNKVNSSVLKATASDCISDVITSSSIIVVTVIGALFLKDKFYIADSIVGIVVSIIICINGFKIIIDSIGDVLGKPADPEDIKAVENVVMSDKHILGTHDLMIHDYGPGRKLATVHAEVDAKSDIVEAHEIIDHLELICYSKTGIELTIHMDPIDVTSKDYIDAKETITKVLKQHEGISFHDLRITDGKHNINVIFDLVIPHEITNEQTNSLIKELKSEVKKVNSIYTCVIKIDRPYI